MSSHQLPHRGPRWHSGVVVLAGFFAAGCHSSANRTPLAVQREAWTYRAIPGTPLTTQHYCIHTTCNDATLLSTIPKVMEGALEAYREAIPSDNLPTEPMPAYLFASRPQW